MLSPSECDRRSPPGATAGGPGTAASEPRPAPRVSTTVPIEQAGQRTTPPRVGVVRGMSRSGGLHLAQLFQQFALPGQQLGEDAPGGPQQLRNVAACQRVDHR